MSIKYQCRGNHGEPSSIRWYNIFQAAAYILEMDPLAGDAFGGNFERVTRRENEKVFESFNINDLLWGYTDPTMEKTLLPSDYATDGLFYEVSQTAYEIY